MLMTQMQAQGTVLVTFAMGSATTQVDTDTLVTPTADCYDSKSNNIDIYRVS